MHGTVLRAVQAKVFDGTVLRTLTGTAPALSATANPSPVAGTGSNPAVDSESTTVTPSGGTGPYSYAWTRTSGTATILSPSSPTTAFRQSGMASDTTAAATFVCTVSDNSGQTATTTVNASFLRVGIT